MNSDETSPNRIAKENRLRLVLEKVGVRKGHHIIFHASYRKIRSEFPGMSIDDLLYTLQQLLTPDGSLIMPTFNLLFQKKVRYFTHLFSRSYSQ